MLRRAAESELRMLTARGVARLKKTPLLAAMIALGCANTTSYLRAPLPPTADTQDVDVVEVSQIPGKYSVIGHVEAYSIRGLQEQARKLGADAIARTGQGLWATYGADAIKYKQDAAPIK